MWLCKETIAPILEANTSEISVQFNCQLKRSHLNISMAAG